MTIPSPRSTGAPGPRGAFIVPSALSANFAYLARDVKFIQEAGARSVQIDVMDGHFVPNITVGPVVIESLRKETTIFLDVHLMIENPLQYIGAFAKAGSNLMTVHWEACMPAEDPLNVIREIKKLGALAGVAIRPKTPADVLFPLLRELDYALVMTVEPGFGGQAFIPAMLDKVRVLRRMIDDHALKCELQVDGGINRQTAGLAAAAGASSLVAGSAVFGAANPAAAFQELQKLVDLASGGQVQ
jgi:ribulose-phosphate 3-epimerase